MKASALTLLLSLLAVPFSATADAMAGADEADALFDDGGRAALPHPEWFEDSFLDLEEDLDEAIAADKKGLLIFFDTEGCSYCAGMLEYTFGDPQTAKQVQAHFDVIALDLFQDDEMTDFSRT